MEFLAQNAELFKGSRNNRKVIKINVQMSTFIGSRSPDQCWSHHQKMIKFHRDIPSIIKYIRGLAASRADLVRPVYVPREPESLPVLQIEASVEREREEEK